MVFKVLYIIVFQYIMELYNVMGAIPVSESGTPVGVAFRYGSPAVMRALVRCLFQVL